MISYNNISAYTNVYLGSQQMSKVYVGTHQVFPTSTPPTPYYFKAQYTMNDATTGEVACNSSSTLSNTDFPNTTNILHITVGECVDGWGTHLVSTHYTSLRTIDLTHSSITIVPKNFMKDVSTLRNAYLNDSTTTISSCAFSGCTSLSAITIPSSVTSIQGSALGNSGLKEITYYSGITYGTYVYIGCSAATAVTIEQGTLSIERGTFAQCSGLTSIEIPSSVTYIGAYAFASCYSLSDVTIPDSVTTIGDSAFLGCNSLTSCTIGSGVTNIDEQAFNYCRGLTSITCNAVTPPTLGTSAFTNTNNCPIYVPCESLEVYKTAWSAYESRLQCIPTPSFTGKFRAEYNGGQQVYSAECDSDSSLTTATTKPSGYEYTAMTEATIGQCVTSLGQFAFSNCSGLQNVTIPDSVTTIGYGVFQNCSGLQNITIPNSVTIISSSAFHKCSGLTSINIPSGVTSIGSQAFYQCSSLTTLDIPDSVTTLSSGMCSGCTSLTSCTIGSGVTSIGDSTFSYCGSLTSVTIPSGVTTIGDWAFGNCSSLTSITVEATTPPTLGNYAFYNTNDCPIYVPCESVEAYKTSWSAYQSRIQCIPTTAITYTASSKANARLSAFTPAATAETYDSTAQTGQVEFSSAVTVIGDSAFYLCTSLSSITIPNSVTSIGIYAFSWCTNLSSITIPDSVTTIGDNAFNSCSGLTNITIPSSVTSIGHSVFLNCISLTNIAIPSSVTSIGHSAFEGCSGLTNVTIPSSVTSIGYRAFYQCSGLTSITVDRTTPPTLGSEVFDFTKDCPIYVPDAAVEDYKAATNWSYYASRIKPLSQKP